MTEYPIKNINEMGLQRQSLEQLGTKEKDWFVDEEGKKFLFKIGRPDTGENWAEKAACELSRFLGLPHAEYEFATYFEKKGVLSPSFIKKPGQLFHGNELLKEVKDTNVGVYKQRHHTIGLVFAMTRLSLPPDASPCSKIIKDGADVFVGYLMLDAWISNQDRHDQNWGVIAFPQSSGEWGLKLAPTCDHASSLGRELSDDERKKRLIGHDKQYNVSAYLAKSRSAMYLTPNDNKATLTLDAFREFALRRPRAARFWLDRLLELDFKNVHEMFAKMPYGYMSEAAKEFAFKMLELNKLSLLGMREQFDE